MKQGDIVWLERDGHKKRAAVIMASENGNSIAVQWEDGLFCGYAGMMPLLRTNGEYRDLIENKPVTVTTIQS
jgi:hypothetical protein